MPRNINGEKLYTHEDLLKIYRQGFVEAGGINPPDGYMEEDLRRAFEENGELVQYAARRIAATAQANFALGLEIGRTKRQVEVFQEMDEQFRVEIAAATKNAEAIGYEAGCIAIHQEDFDKGKTHGEQEALTQTKIEQERIGNEAIDQFLEDFRTRSRENYFFKLIGRIPLSSSQYKGMPQKYLRGIPIDLGLRPPLRVAHFRLDPAKVGSRFLLFYAIPVVLSCVLFKAWTRHKEEVIALPEEIGLPAHIKPYSEDEELQNAEAYGEESEQYRSHRKVRKAGFLTEQWEIAQEALGYHDDFERQKYFTPQYSSGIAPEIEDVCKKLKQ